MQVLLSRNRQIFHLLKSWKICANLSCMFAKACCLLLLLAAFLLAPAQRHTVLIHEIFADPTPAVGLPDAEYIELRNTTSTAINLQSWRLQTASSTSSAFPAYILQPDSLVVVTGRSNASMFASNTIGLTSFPALPNDGTTLMLRNAAGFTIHVLEYDKAWYQNPVKAEGGWSLEMMDASNACGGSTNWKAAVDATGGTPGRANSVKALNPDQTPPTLADITAPDSTRLLLRFSESMDSLAAARATYQLTPTIAISRVIPQPPLFNTILLQLNSPLQRGQQYSVAVSNLTDCAGNTIASGSTAPAGLPLAADKGDVLINEILFNPKDDGSDYVELYNRSKKIIDCSGLWLANRNGSGFSNLQQISATPRYLFPGQYLALTEDRNAILRQYLVKEPGALLQMTELPSLPDDKGSIALLTAQSGLIDELAYNRSWHFALISDDAGVALERIDPEKPTQAQYNWTSAAASAGFGTPTYRNAQYQQTGSSNTAISITPKVVSPDGDGFDDFCTISYALDAPNYVANVTLFDIGGRRVRYLVQSQTLAQSGNWRWDGLGDNNSPLPQGHYILLAEFFNLQGKKQQFKLAIALARK